VELLQRPEVRAAPAAQRVAFLRRKGLPDADILAAFHEVPREPFRVVRCLNLSNICAIYSPVGYMCAILIITNPLFFTRYWHPIGLIAIGTVTPVFTAHIQSFVPGLVSPKRFVAC